MGHLKQLHQELHIFWEGGGTPSLSHRRRLLLLWAGKRVRHTHSENADFLYVLLFLWTNLQLFTIKEKPRVREKPLRTHCTICQNTSIFSVFFYETFTRALTSISQFFLQQGRSLGTLSPPLSVSSGNKVTVILPSLKKKYKIGASCMNPLNILKDFAQFST